MKWCHLCRFHWILFYLFLKCVALFLFHLRFKIFIIKKSRTHHDVFKCDIFEMSVKASDEFFVIFPDKNRTEWCFLMESCLNLNFNISQLTQFRRRFRKMLSESQTKQNQVHLNTVFLRQWLLKPWWTRVTCDILT